MISGDTLFSIAYPTGNLFTYFFFRKSVYSSPDKLGTIIADTSKKGLHDCAFGKILIFEPFHVIICNSSVHGFIIKTISD